MRFALHKKLTAESLKLLSVGCPNLAKLDLTAAGESLHADAVVAAIHEMNWCVW